MAHDVRRLKDGSIDYDAYRCAAARLRYAAWTTMVRRLVGVILDRRANCSAFGWLKNKILDMGFLLLNVFLFRSIKGRSHETQ